MAKREFEKGVGYWILSAANLLERAANEDLAPHGITFRQVQILGSLAHAGEISQTALADMIQVEPSTIVRILDRMERDGWIERISKPNDRRVKLIRTTDKVEPVWRTIMDCGKRIRARATRGMSDRQAQQLIDSLEAVCANLGGE